MSKTQTAHTAHGQVEYEVVECDSCGTNVLPDETVVFTIGDREGVACKMCEDSGPVSLPKQTIDMMPSVPEHYKTGKIYGLTFYILSAVIVVPITILAGLTGGEEFDQGFAAGVVTILVYVAFVMAVLLV